MAQNAEASRSAPPGKPRSTPPGIGPTIAIALISGAVCWFWLASEPANLAKSTEPAASQLTEVEEAEIADALTTMDRPTAELASFREGKDGCRRPLAWVSLVSAPGEPAGHIRLISGTYVSPLFEVSATPVRVALPFPAPYEAGHGTLTAIDVGGSALVSLIPAWRVAAQDHQTVRAVTWRPVTNCSPRNG